MNLEDFLKSLTTEQGKKIAKCKNVKELDDLFRKEKIAIPDELLKNVSGGTGMDYEEERMRGMSEIFALLTADGFTSAAGNTPLSGDVGTGNMYR